MDVQKTMEFILEQQSHFSANIEVLTERLNSVTEKLDTLAERQLQAEERQTQAEERHERDMFAIRAELRRGVRLSIEEQRRERVRRKETGAHVKGSGHSSSANRRATQDV